MSRNILPLPYYKGGGGMMNPNLIRLPDGQLALHQVVQGCEATLVFCAEAQPNTLKDVTAQIMAAYAERREQDSKRSN